MIAALVFATVVGTVVYQREHRGRAVPVTTTTSTTAAGVCGSPNQAITCFPLARTVERGDKGDDVRRIQQRLKDLHFEKPQYLNFEIT